MAISIHQPSIILTLQDYCEYRHRKPLFVSTLSELFVKKAFLFVGYGLRDFTFNSILAELRSDLGAFKRRAFVLTKDEWGIKKEVLRSLGLEVIAVTDFDDIPFILRAISQEQTTVDIVRRQIDKLPKVVTNTLSNSSLLLIDDDWHLIESISWIFKHYGWRGFEAEPDPEKAIRKLQRSTYDFIITDLAMPRFSGVDLIREIRKGKKNRHSIVVVWSGYLEDDQCLLAGADFYFRKPTRIEEIFRTLFLLRRLHKGDY